MGFQIAIDGPAGAGKSTIARRVAKKKGFIYVDTGAMYRAMALFFLRENVASDQTAEITRRCREAEISICHENNLQIVTLNGERVDALLRTEQVGEMASASSSNPAVRERLLGLQRQLAGDNDVVMDGRDIGTCILPGAQVKIFLTAGSQVRALRRYKELTARGVPCDLEVIEKEIVKRDKQDTNRAVSPLRQAEDAVLIDTSDMTIAQVVAVIMEIIEKKEIFCKNKKIL